MSPLTGSFHEWTIMRLNEEDGSEVDTIDLAAELAIPSKTSFELALKEKTLDYGLYKLRLVTLSKQDTGSLSSR